MAYNGQYRIVNVDGRTGCTQSAIFVDEAAVSNVTTNREVSLMSGKYKIDQDVSHPLLITSRQNNRIPAVSQVRRRPNRSTAYDFNDAAIGNGTARPS